jgi:hypothetical protein
MPTIHDLPNELLLETLSYLDHSDLQNCLQTTNALRAIAFHPALDHKLFRSKVVKHKHDTIDMDTIVIHPIFSCIMYTNKMLRPEDPCILTSRATNDLFYTGISVLHSRIHEDNATSPPVSYIRTSVNTIENEDKSAITVGQVYTELIRHNVELQDAGILDWCDSIAYDLYINCLKWRTARWEGTDEHVEVRCKDMMMVSRCTHAAYMGYVRTRDNGTVFVEAASDPWEMW